MREIGEEHGARYDATNYDSDKLGYGASTTYVIPRGGLIGFVRDHVRYTVLNDALGSVRRVIGIDGSVISSFETDTCGNALDVADSVLTGWSYRYVGAYGCRYDADTGLTYMRQRWYDAGLQRFVSRDVLQNGNRFTYATNMPTRLIDPNGLVPVDGVNVEFSSKFPTAASSLYEGYIHKVMELLQNEKCSGNMADTIQHLRGLKRILIYTNSDTSLKSDIPNSL